MKRDDNCNTNNGNAKEKMNNDNAEEKMNVNNGNGSKLLEDKDDKNSCSINEENCVQLENRHGKERGSENVSFGDNENCSDEACNEEQSCDKEERCTGNEVTLKEETSEEEGNLDLQKQLEEKSKKCDEYFQMLQRLAAEFDNYKKRVVREKEAIYIDALSDTIKAFLPVIDSVERAVRACSGQSDAGSLKEGIELIHRQIKDVLENLGVEEIKGQGENFNPDLHNAVMHIEDEAYGANVIVEEFQKGYIYKGRVIRHSMVKVAN